MKRLYQTASVLLVMVLGVWLSGSVYAYDNPICDADGDGKSDCTRSQVCYQTLNTYSCGSIGGDCGQCPSGQYCISGILRDHCEIGIPAGTSATASGSGQIPTCDPSAPNTCSPGTSCYCTGATCRCVPNTQCDINGCVTSAPAVYGRIPDINYYGSREGINEFLRLVYQALLPIATLLGVLFVILAGYGLMTSQGDPQKTMEAKEQLTSAIMGMLFILLGAVILRRIISTLIQGEPSGF